MSAFYVCLMCLPDVSVRARALLHRPVVLATGGRRVTYVSLTRNICVSTTQAVVLATIGRRVTYVSLTRNICVSNTQACHACDGWPSSNMCVSNT